MKNLLLSLILLPLLLITLSASSPVESTISPVVESVVIEGPAVSVPVVVSDSLGEIVASNTADLDSSLPESYPGSGQTWANIETTPADSSNQTDWDTFLGADGTVSSDDPAHTSGTPDFWLYDNTNFHAFKDITNTIFEDAHKTTGASPMTIAMIIKFADTATAQAFFGNTAGIAKGVRLLSLGTGALLFTQRGDTAAVNTTITATGFITSGSFLFLAIGWDTSSAGSERLWLNSSTSTAWLNTHVPNTSTLGATDTMIIGASQVDGSNSVNDGTEIVHFSVYNEIVSDANMALVIAHLEARTGLDLTP